MYHACTDQASRRPVLVCGERDCNGFGLKFSDLDAYFTPQTQPLTKPSVANEARENRAYGVRIRAELLYGTMTRLP